MHTMSNRAASATSSRRAKQELVRLLFGHQYTRTNPQGHARLDFSIYSYNDLKSAYLKRVQVLHPDKSQPPQAAAKASHDATRREFVQLKEAWNRYEKIAKMMKRVDGDRTEASFTKFGVGCSFADSEQERAQRNEIMDQAGRGWFSAGALGTGTDDQVEEADSAPFSHKVPLSNDDDFVDAVDEPSRASASMMAEESSRRNLLIRHLIHPSRR